MHDTRLFKTAQNTWDCFNECYPRSQNHLGILMFQCNNVCYRKGDAFGQLCGPIPNSILGKRSSCVQLLSCFSAEGHTEAGHNQRLKKVCCILGGLLFCFKSESTLCFTTSHPIQALYIRSRTESSATKKLLLV